MKQNLKKWLNTILILIAVTILGVSIYVTRRKTVQLDEPQRNGEVSILEEEKEQGDIEGTQEQETMERERYDMVNGTNNRSSLPRTQEEGGYPETEVTSYIKEIFGEDAGFILRLAWCESRLNPGAVSPTGRYIGLFQFDVPTWTGQCSGDIYDWHNQTLCAKKLIDKGEIWRWPTCGSGVE